MMAKRSCVFQISLTWHSCIFLQGVKYKLQVTSIRFFDSFLFSDESEMNLMMNGTGEGIGKIQFEPAYSKLVI